MRGRLTLFHADLYPLERAETEDLGLQDADVAAGVLAVEWPERLARPITDATNIAIEVSEKTIDGSR